MAKHFPQFRPAPRQHSHVGPALHGAWAWGAVPRTGGDWPGGGSGSSSTAAGPGPDALHRGSYHGGSAVCQRGPSQPPSHVRQVLTRAGPFVQRCANMVPHSLHHMSARYRQGLVFGPAVSYTAFCTSCVRQAQTRAGHWSSDIFTSLK